MSTNSGGLPADPTLRSALLDRERRLEKSAVGQAGDRVSASSRSGFPNPMVTRRSWISRRISSGLGPLGTMTVPPVNRTGSTFTPVPTSPEERRDSDGYVVASEIDHREEVDDVPGDVAVRQHHPFRCPRCARGMRKHAHIVESDVLAFKLC